MAWTEDTKMLLVFVVIVTAAIALVVYLAVY